MYKCYMLSISKIMLKIGMKTYHNHIAMCFTYRKCQHDKDWVESTSSLLYPPSKMTIIPTTLFWKQINPRNEKTHVHCFNQFNKWISSMLKWIHHFLFYLIIMLLYVNSKQMVLSLYPVKYDFFLINLHCISINFST
jgi:hypothetical protein